MLEKLKAWFREAEKPLPESPGETSPKDPRSEIEIVPSAERIWNDGLTPDERLDVQLIENIRLNEEVRELRKRVRQLESESFTMIIAHQKVLNERDTFERVARAIKEAFK